MFSQIEIRIPNARNPKEGRTPRTELIVAGCAGKERLDRMAFGNPARIRPGGGTSRE